MIKGLSNVTYYDIFHHIDCDYEGYMGAANQGG
jgi:hypothetical protein